MNRLDNYLRDAATACDSQPAPVCTKSMEIPVISIIIIVRNNDALLARAIDSITLQNLDNIEIIIVNDGSMDNTKHVIDTYADYYKYIRPIHLKINAGRANARNIGLKNALGEYILFLDSDDQLPGNSLSLLLDTAEKYNADIVYGAFSCIDVSTGRPRKGHYTEKIINKERHGIKLEDHLPLLENHHVVGRLYSRSLLSSNDIKFSVSRKNGEDVSFSFYAAFHAERISLAPDINSYCYSIGNYFIKANKQKLFDARDNVIETMDFAKKKGSPVLVRQMKIKGATFGAQLARAGKVFGEDVDAMTSYIASLTPLYDDLSEDVLSAISPYERNFANAVCARDYLQAYKAWQDHNSTIHHKTRNLASIFMRNKSGTMESASRKKGTPPNNRILNRLYWARVLAFKCVGNPRYCFCKVRERVFGPSKNTQTDSIPLGASIPKPGLDMSPDIQNKGFGRHRSGWQFALSALRPMHNPDGVFFVSFLEKPFVWGGAHAMRIQRPWVGVTHRPLSIPEWFPEPMRRQFFDHPDFLASINACRGIFTLSEYHAAALSSHIEVPIETLIHPTEIPDRQWTDSALNQGQLQVVQIGWWLRNMHAIFMLPSGNYQKVFLSKNKVERAAAAFFETEAQHLKGAGQLKSSMYDTATTIDFLGNDLYDELLSTCVIFLNLYDASANNAVVEAIARATPILVNPLPSVVEYLGEGYPLYYSSLDEAAEKLHDHDLIRAASLYLANSPMRRKLSGKYFRDSLLTSSIYTNIFGSSSTP